MGLLKKFIHDTALANQDDHVELDEPLVKTTKFALYDEKAIKAREEAKKNSNPNQKERLELEQSVEPSQAQRLRFTRYKSMLLDNYITQEEFDLLNKEFNDNWNY